MNVSTKLRAAVLLAAGIAAAGCSDGPAPAGVPEAVDPDEAAAELEAASAGGEPEGEQDSGGPR